MTDEHLAGLWTLIALIAFLSVCAWAYSGKRRSSFEDAANLPFADEDVHKATLDTSLENDNVDNNEQSATSRKSL